jgi:hypothetical protein
MNRLLRNHRGFALESTIVVMVLLTVLIGAAVTSAVMTQRTAGVDYRGSRVSYATEAGADNVMSQLEVAMADGIVTPAELAALTPPVVPGFTYSPISTVAGAAVPRTITSGPFAGLIGLNQAIDITVEARDALANRARDIVTVNAQSIPLFQFGVFYEEDLEIHNGPQLDFMGWIHTNGNLYLSPGSGPTNFHSLITTPDSMFEMRKASNAVNTNIFIDDASGVAHQLLFDSRNPPPGGFVAASQATFNGRVMTGESGVTPLQLPLPAGMPAVEMIRPRNAGDTPQVQSVKFAWKATWHMTVDMSLMAAGPVCATNAITTIPAGHPVPNAAECPLIFSSQVNAFQEGRENIGADVLQIDIGQLQNWVGAAPMARDASIIYITFTNVDPAITERDYPVVRLVNGALLLRPMSIATDRPLYVWNNFNTIGWQPASFLADAITFLSSSWTDAAHPWNAAWNPNVDQSFPVTNATPMTVYAAIAVGHSATPCDVNRVAPACVPTSPPPFTGGALPNYGGGLENYPRFLENWGGVTMTYRGSLVSLFQSDFAKRRRWGWQSYYSPPNRDWQFDLRFQDPNNLPPGTPTVGSVVQTAFRPVY